MKMVRRVVLFLSNGRQSGQELISFYWRDVLPTGVFRLAVANAMLGARDNEQHSYLEIGYGNKCHKKLDRKTC